MELLKQHIEALIFVAEQNITIEEIQSSLKTAYGWELEKKEILEVLEQLKEQYNNEEYSFELVEIAEGFQFLTKKEYHTAVNTLLQIKAKKRLSTAALETLAIIAYKQPISKSEMEHIRGVSCDYSIQKLLEKELIIIQGKSDGPGKPLIYATSKSFMDHFGLKTVKDLPKLKDLHISENEIGTPADLLDSLMPDDSQEEQEANVEDLVKAAEDVMDTPLTEELEQHLQNGDALETEGEDKTEE
ncbi:MAG: SMC-Scp complex subunit ScpB [Bacteroidota bacterium]